ncbi:O-Antigen ligase [Rubripirellula amarantea]|uniref:O-Antigen ligase n=2 Tax=Rubripirellula amarantea TaxID=2527999 RepID=A0A5C5WW67_9BACT|nr:O-Antigen ligase [Rubripirellula amarantea]
MNTVTSHTAVSPSSKTDDPGTTAPTHVESARGAVALHRYVMASIWLLPIMAFTTPTDSIGKSWETLDSVKLVILAFGCFGGAFVLYRNVGHPQFRRVIDPLIPMFLYFAWTVLSVTWSPLKSVSLAQSGSLAALLIFATSIAIICTSRTQASKVLLHVNLALLASSLVVLIAYVIDPTLSGMDRVRIHTGGEALIHPTAAGATASLGLLLPVLCHVIGRFTWAKYLFIPSVLIQGAIVILSNSRTATGMAAITIGFVLFWYSTNRQRAVALCLGGAVCLASLIVDPGFSVISKTAGASAQYVARGQSGGELMGFSGRAEMWGAIWSEYQKALLIGHGYFVTSEKGEILVWNEKHNHDAHNLLLQVLSTTGAIGLLIFLLGIVQPALAMTLLRKGDDFQRRLFVMLAVAAIWYLGWAQLAVSVMGAIRPESLVFFALLGVGVGQSTQMAMPGKKLNRPGREPEKVMAGGSLSA